MDYAVALAECPPDAPTHKKIEMDMWWRICWDHARVLRQVGLLTS